MSETYAAETWLYETLHGDATLMAAASGVFADLAPSGQALPYVVFSFESGRDLLTVNGVRIWAEAQYAVKGIVEGRSFGALVAIAGRIDALLHRQCGTVSGGIVVECLREEPLRYVEQAGGETYLHLGGLYRIRVQ